MPWLEVYRIIRIDEDKSPNNENLNNQENNKNQLKDLVNIQLAFKYEMPHEFMNFEDDNYRNIFNIYENNRKHCRLNIDNKGNLIFIYEERKIFFINGNNEWTTFKNYLERYKIESINKFDIISIGQDWIVFKIKQIIYTLNVDYTNKRIIDMKEINHRAVDMKEWSLEYITPTKINHVFLLFYRLGNSDTIVVYDFKEDREICSFSSREDEFYTDYVIGK